MCDQLLHPGFVIKTSTELSKPLPTIEVGFFGNPPHLHCYAKILITWRLQGGVLRPFLLVDQLDWRVLDKMRGIFRRMSQLCDQKITPERFTAILTAAGYHDFTAYGSVDEYLD